MSKKPIIVFEGIEGSGKSHHINKVSKYLDKKKINYIRIREPCLLYTSPSPRDISGSRMPSSA